MAIFTLTILLLGPGLNKTVKLSRGLVGAEDFVANLAAQNKPEIDGAVTATKVSGGFQWALSATSPQGVHEAIDITQHASGIAELVEGFAIGSGKTWEAKITLDEAPAPATA